MMAMLPVEPCGHQVHNLVNPSTSFYSLSTQADVHVGNVPRQFAAEPLRTFTEPSLRSLSATSATSEGQHCPARSQHDCSMLGPLPSDWVRYAVGGPTCVLRAHALSCQHTQCGGGACLGLINMEDGESKSYHF